MELAHTRTIARVKIECLPKIYLREEVKKKKKINKWNNDEPHQKSTFWNYIYDWTQFHNTTHYIYRNVFTHTRSFTTVIINYFENYINLKCFVLSNKRIVCGNNIASLSAKYTRPRWHRYCTKLNGKSATIRWKWKSYEQAI